MSTTVYTVDAERREYEEGVSEEIGWRVGIGEHRTAFVWVREPSEMERWTAFVDDYGRVYDRSGLQAFIEACDEVHPLGCNCERHGHPTGEEVNPT